MSATEILVATITVDEALAPKGASWLAGSGSPYVGVDAIDLPDSVLDRVFTLYKASYARLPSEPPGTPTFNIQDARALLEYDRFVLIATPDSTIVGFVLAKTTAHGVKIGATGQDGSRAARAAILAFHIDALNTPTSTRRCRRPWRRRSMARCPLCRRQTRRRFFKGRHWSPTTTASTMPTHKIKSTECGEAHLADDFRTL